MSKIVEAEDFIFTNKGVILIFNNLEHPYRWSYLQNPIYMQWTQIGR